MEFTVSIWSCGGTTVSFCPMKAQAGVLRDPGAATHRMRTFLAVAGAA